jgi:hypothetical protein
LVRYDEIRVDLHSIDDESILSLPKVADHLPIVEQVGASARVR